MAGEPPSVVPPGMATGPHLTAPSCSSIQTTPWATRTISGLGSASKLAAAVKPSSTGPPGAEVVCQRICPCCGPEPR